MNYDERIYYDYVIKGYVNISKTRNINYELSTEIKESIEEYIESRYNNVNNKHPEE